MRIINMSLLGIVILALVYFIGSGIQKRVQYSSYVTVKGITRKLPSKHKKLRAPAYIIYNWRGETYGFSDPSFYALRDNYPAKVAIDAKRNEAVYLNTWSHNGTLHLIVSIGFFIITVLLFLLLLVTTI